MSRATATTSRAVVATVLFVLAFAACDSRSEEDIKREFDEYVADRNHCVGIRECEIVMTECPLGCHRAVNGQHAADVEAKARELEDEYQSGGRDCDYGCMEPETLACVDGRCTLGPDGDGGTGY